MNAFVDSSALYALTIAEDLHHAQAVACFEELQGLEAMLTTTNYVLLECASLVQRRYGMVHAQGLLKKAGGLLDVLWIGAEEHEHALKLWAAEGRRALSLVDCTSVVVMRQHQIHHVVAFDRHFTEAGFEMLPQADRVAEPRARYRANAPPRRPTRGVARKP